MYTVNVEMAEGNNYCNIVWFPSHNVILIPSMFSFVTLASSYTRRCSLAAAL